MNAEARRIPGRQSGLPSRVRVLLVLDDSVFYPLPFPRAGVPGNTGQELGRTARGGTPGAAPNRFSKFLREYSRPTADAFI
jgi:hypothetical protein